MKLLDRLRIRLLKEPVIWTKHGNVAESSLRRQVTWHIEPDYIKVVTTYYDASDDVVKQGADVLSRQGITADIAVGKVNGQLF